MEIYAIFGKKKTPPLKGGVSLHAPLENQKVLIPFQKVFIPFQKLLIPFAKVLLLFAKVSIIPFGDTFRLSQRYIHL